MMKIFMEMRRRDFIQGLAGLTGLAGGAFCGCFSPAEKREADRGEGYKEWFEKSIEKNELLVRHRYFRNEEYSPNPDELNLIMKILNEKAKGFRFSSVKFERGVFYSPFISSEKAWDEYCDKQLKIAGEFFKFIGMRKPGIRFQVLQDDVKPENSEERVANVYIADRFSIDTVCATFSLENSVQGSREPRVYINSNVSSFCGGRIKMTINNKRVEISAERAPIFVGLYDAPYSYHSLIHELMHNEIAQNSLNWIRREVEREIKSGKSAEQIAREAHTIEERRTRYEEGIVRAIAIVFMEQYGKKEGFTDKDISRLLELTPKNKAYELVEGAYKFLRNGDSGRKFRGLLGNYEMLEKKR